MVYLQPIYKNMSDNYNQDIASSIKTLLSEIGENLEREGLLKTPEAQHLCMQMRGVQKQHSSTTTAAFSGIFMSDEKTRAEFMNLIK